MLEKEIDLGTGEDKRVYAQRARALTEHELRGRLRAAGLTIVGAWGDFDGSVFDGRRSPRLVLLASRPTSKAFGAAGPVTVPLDRVPGIPALARGLATGAPDVSEFLPRLPSRAAVAARAAAVRSAFRPRTLPAGADPRLAALARAERAAVLTGQQAGLFGGPHLTLVKAVAAEKIAADLSAAGTPASAAFWCAAEDHDLVEVTRVVLPTPEGPRDFGPDPAPLAANRAPVGALPITADVDGSPRGGRREPRQPAGRGGARRASRGARGPHVPRGVRADARLAPRRRAPARRRGRRRRQAGARPARGPHREGTARRAGAAPGARRGAHEGGPSAPGEDRRGRAAALRPHGRRAPPPRRGRRASLAQGTRRGLLRGRRRRAPSVRGVASVVLGAHAAACGLGSLPRRRDGPRSRGGRLLGAGLAPVRMGGNRPARRPPPPLRRASRRPRRADCSRSSTSRSRTSSRGRTHSSERRAQARRARSSRASRRFPNARSRSSTRRGPRSSRWTPRWRRPSPRRARSSRSRSRSSSRRRESRRGPRGRPRRPAGPPAHGGAPAGRKARRAALPGPAVRPEAREGRRRRRAPPRPEMGRARPAGDRAVNLAAAVPVDVLAFGPHPDDVELGCGGTLASLAGRGRGVGIVDLTRGEMATRGTPETRASEAAEAARLLGARFRVNLDLGDGDLRTDRRGAAPRRRGRAARPAPPRPRTVDGGSPPRPRARGPPRGGGLLVRGPREARDGPPGAPARPGRLLRGVRAPSADVPRGRDGVLRDEARGAPRVQEPVPRLSGAPPSGEPETYVSSKSFWDGVEARARAYGRIANVAYAEGFVSKAPPTLADPAGAFEGYEGAKP